MGDNKSRKGSDNKLDQSKLDRLEERVENFVKDIKKKVVTSKEIQKMANKFDNFMSRRENPAFLVKFDELAFSFNVLSFFLTFGLLFYPDIRVLATWTTIVNVILIALRFFSYYSLRWHMYFFDYCYYVNVLSWIYLWVFPKSPTVFMMAAFNAACPMLNYFIIFKPKLVYQNREAVTSFYMHYTPAMLFWIIRYYNNSSDSPYVLTQEIDAILAQGWSSQLWAFGMGMAFYAGWVLFYYICIFHILDKKITACGYQTLFSYTVESIQTFNPWILKFGKKPAPIMYMVLHLFQGFLGNLMSLVFINSKWLSLLILLLYLLFPIWTSSVYYFEYFSRDYNKKLEGRAEFFKEQRKKRSLSVETRERRLSEEAARQSKLEVSSPKLKDAEGLDMSTPKKSSAGSRDKKNK